jgi:hypothetical protein
MASEVASQRESIKTLNGVQYAAAPFEKQTINLDDPNNLNSKLHLQNFRIYQTLKKKMEKSIDKQRKALKNSIMNYQPIVYAPQLNNYSSLNYQKQASMRSSYWSERQASQRNIKVKPILRSGRASSTNASEHNRHNTGTLNSQSNFNFYSSEGGDGMTQKGHYEISKPFQRFKDQ